MAASYVESYTQSVLCTLIDIFLWKLIFDHITNLDKFFSRLWFDFQSDFSVRSSGKKRQSAPDPLSHAVARQDDGSLGREDVEMVMRELGLFCSKECEELGEIISSDDLSTLFDENEPSLEEVKQAFDVFDENKDGFIDAEELQTVLCRLGLREGLEISNCRRIIKVFDDNGDGRLSFKDFVKFMEHDFC